MSDETKITTWQPPQFNGTDLLPALAPQVEMVEYEADDDTEAGDIILPGFSVLQGQSKPVQDGEPGATPGKFYLSGTVFEPPVRVIVVGRFRGNAMFVRKKDPRFEGLEDCISRDGVTGSQYGDCASCGKCTEWVDDQPPLGAKTQQFVLWTEAGICILRIAYSNKYARNYTREIITKQTTMRRNWFAHPMHIVAAQHNNDDGDSYHVPRLIWDTKEVVPMAVQEEAAKLYGQMREALEHGKLGEQDATASDAAGDEPTGKQATKDQDIPF